MGAFKFNFKTLAERGIKIFTLDSDSGAQTTSETN